MICSILISEVLLCLSYEINGNSLFFFSEIFVVYIINSVCVFACRIVLQSYRYMQVRFEVLVGFYSVNTFIFTL
jgi:hypothetical protein